MDGRVEDDGAGSSSKAIKTTGKKMRRSSIFDTDDADSESEIDSDDEIFDPAEEERLFRVQEDELQQYLTNMRLDNLFTELVEELLVEAPTNPVKFMIDYLFTHFPDQAFESSYAKTFPNGMNSVGGGIPLTGLTPVETSRNLKIKLGKGVEDGEEEEEEEQEEGDHVDISIKPKAENMNDDENEKEHETNDDENENILTNQAEKPSERRSGKPKQQLLQMKRRNAIMMKPKKQIEENQEQKQAQMQNTRVSTELPNENQLSKLENFMKTNLILQQLNDQQIQAVKKQFRLMRYQYDQIVFSQDDCNDDAETFYFVLEGQCEHHADGKCIIVSNVGDSFGEFALFYESPRRTTVKISSSEGALLLGITRKKYQEAVSHASKEFRNETKSYLEKINLFSTLTDVELLQLCEDVVLEKVFKKDEFLVKQHEPGDEMIIIKHGMVRCEQKLGPSDPSVEVIKFQEGDWFGEVSLITDRPRAASIIAESSAVTCLIISRDRFVRVFGPLTQILERDAELFKRFVTDKI